MEWIKKDGTRIKTNDKNPANAEIAKMEGWKSVKEDKNPKEKRTPSPNKEKVQTEIPEVTK